MLENKEWDIIRSLANAGERDNPFIGDDCAFWREKNLFVTTDHMVEGHHFDLSFMPPETVGWRIMAANASDVISMGSKPTHFLLNIAIPSERYETGRKILEGIQKFAQTHGITLMGGDTTGGNSFFIGVTMFGEKKCEPWLRSGAKPGDRIFIASHPGLSLTGFIALKQGYDGFEESKKRFLSPDPYPLAPKSGKIHGAVDISDSLVSELKLISGFSKVGLSVDIDKIPVHPEVRKMAKLEDVPVEKLLLTSGEEFFLLATSPETIENFYEIGMVEDENGEVNYIKNGSPFDPSDFNAYSHFGG